MPELPEVEVIRAGLSYLVGYKLTFFCTSGKRLRVPIPLSCDTLVNQEIVAINRRGKYLLFEFSSKQVLVIHLGMSGKLFSYDGHFNFPVGYPKHTHALFYLKGLAGDFVSMAFVDPRRFGLLELKRAEDINSCKWLKNLGAEPFSKDLTTDYFLNIVSSRKGNIKNILMDQRVIAGIGNIYASEILFSSRIKPSALVPNIFGNHIEERFERASKLIFYTKEILGEAISSGGSSINDYVNSLGKPGQFQDKFWVYGRAFKSCKRQGCKGIIMLKVIAGRATYYCPECQIIG